MPISGHLVGQVQPPMTNNELNKMFLNTLKAPYYDRMIGNSNNNFSNVVSVGKGLGKRLQDMLKSIVVIQKKD